MSRSARTGIFIALPLLAAALLAPPVSAADYGLGQAATPAQVAQWNIDVRADGQGLPSGHGSVAEGEAIYEQKCSSCHGTFGDSSEYMQIAGGVGTLTSNAPLRTTGSKLDAATTLFDYINRAMPFPTPKTLTPNEVYALTAYVLNLNDIVPADAVLDQDSLPKVQMPNRNGFTREHGFGSIDGKPDTHNRRCMKNCKSDEKLTSELPPGFTQKLYGDISQQFRALATMNHASVVALAEGAQAGDAAVGAQPAGLQLIQKNGCVACHGLTQKIVGPTFRDVAMHYKGQADVADKLVAKIAAGGAGNWGQIPMPPQPQMTEQDRRTIVNWILAGASEH